MTKILIISLLLLSTLALSGCDGDNPGNNDTAESGLNIVPAFIVAALSNGSGE